jgi:hypothetical protein
MKLFRLFILGIIATALLPVNIVSAQEQFKLTGVVFEKGTNIRIALAEVTNKRNKYVVGSNDMGLFTITASVGDTLIISKRNFTPLAVVVTSPKDVVSYLTRAVNNLNEVTVYGQTKKQELDAIKRDFRNKGSFYAGKPPLLSYVLSPLTAIYELFGRTPKNARRFNKMYVTELQQSHVDQFFNKAAINANTGLEGKELENFMVNYRPDYEKSKNWTQYDGIKWINDSYKKYADTAKKTIK